MYSVKTKKKVATSKAYVGKAYLRAFVLSRNITVFLENNILLIVDKEKVEKVLIVSDRSNVKKTDKGR